MKKILLFLLPLLLSACSVNEQSGDMRKNGFLLLKRSEIVVDTSVQGQDINVHLDGSLLSFVIRNDTIFTDDSALLSDTIKFVEGGWTIFTGNSWGLAGGHRIIDTLPFASFPLPDVFLRKHQDSLKIDSVDAGNTIFMSFRDIDTALAWGDIFIIKDTLFDTVRSGPAIMAVIMYKFKMIYVNAGFFPADRIVLVSSWELDQMRFDPVTHQLNWEIGPSE